jgi:DNA-binding response OmpR family regulator
VSQEQVLALRRLAEIALAVTLSATCSTRSRWRWRSLSAFVRHRGRVLSRDQLLNEAWGQGTFLTDRVVDNHIVSLRRKIEPNPADPTYLVSVRGLGYRFDG